MTTEEQQDLLSILLKRSKAIEGDLAGKLLIQEEKRKKKFDSLEDINQIFLNHYKDNVRFIKRDNEYDIEILYPEVTITNQRAECHTIYNLIIKLTLQFTSSNVWVFREQLKGKRPTISYMEKELNFHHSHLCDMDLTTFGSFCLGTGTVREILLSLSKEINLDSIELLCYILDAYVRWEDLIGKPYKYMINIYTRNNNGQVVYDSNVKKAAIYILTTKKYYKNFQYNGLYYRFDMAYTELGKDLFKFSPEKCFFVNGGSQIKLTKEAILLKKEKISLKEVGTLDFNGKKIPIGITDIDENFMKILNSIEADCASLKFCERTSICVNDLLKVIMTEEYLKTKKN